MCHGIPQETTEKLTEIHRLRIELERANTEIAHLESLLMKIERIAFTSATLATIGQIARNRRLA